MKNEDNIIIEAHHITKSFGIYRTNRHDVIKGINLQVKNGEFVCIMGASGSGKTTLLNMLSTIDTPTTGSVKIKNTSISQLGMIELANFRYKYLGFIFQDFFLNERFSVFTNIATPLIINNENEETIKKRVNEITKRLGIQDQLEKNVEQCSRGQKQRVAIARALITKPSLLIADEPTGNLDQRNAHDLLNTLQYLNKELNLTIVLVTHDLLVASYSSHFYYLKDGEITKSITCGTLTQLEYLQQIKDCFEE